MVGVTLYVEGGGDGKVLKTACRRGFSEFLSKAGVTNRPRIVACGTRRQAFQDFCAALDKGDRAVLLLVDSEDAVTSESPWDHLAHREDDNWKKPERATDAQCHLMVQCMESWLLAHDSPHFRLLHYYAQAGTTLLDTAFCIRLGYVTRGMTRSVGPASRCRWRGDLASKPTALESQEKK